MRFEYIDPFVTSTVKVLESVLRSDVTRGEISLVGPADLKGDISILIPVRGESEGRVMLAMGSETALGICGSMNGAHFNAVDELALDTIAELANMITGNATSALSDLGYGFTVFPPSVVKGDAGLEGSAEILHIPVGTEYGTITIYVSMRTN